MNATYVAIGAAFVAIGSASIARSRKAEDGLKAKNSRIGGASFAQSRKAEDETKAKNSRIAGILMMLAGFIFMATGALAGN